MKGSLNRTNCMVREDYSVHKGSMKAIFVDQCLKEIVALRDHWEIHIKVNG